MTQNYSGELDWLVKTPIAHRGLHDGNVATPENSLPSFQKAMDKGFAIECDIRLSKDRIPVVFHDATLDRMTAEKGLVSDRTAAELSKVKLAGSDATIPSLQDMLDLVAGKVPLVVEMKGTSREADAGFVDIIAPTIKAYKGDLALMSFNDWLLDQLIAAKLGRPVGLTAEGREAADLDRNRSVFDRGCDFTSYNFRHLPNSFVDWVRNERRLPVVSWTVKTLPEAALSASNADQMTFEAFLPQG